MTGELFLWNDICCDRTVASARVVTTSCLALEAGGCDAAGVGLANVDYTGICD